MKKFKLSVSIYCAGYSCLKESIAEIEQNQIDYIHIDIMDGHFAPCMSGGPSYLSDIRKFSTIPLDIHIMAEPLEPVLKLLHFCKGDRVCVHYESTRHIQRIIDELKDQEVKAGVAINPGTPINVLDNILPEIDLINVMTINPGQAGHGLIPYTLDKISQLRSIIDRNGYHAEIEQDGGSDFANIKSIADAGADIIVLGARSCYAEGVDFSYAIEQIRQAIL